MLTGRGRLFGAGLREDGGWRGWGMGSDSSGMGSLASEGTLTGRSNSWPWTRPPCEGVIYPCNQTQGKRHKKKTHQSTFEPFTADRPLPVPAPVGRTTLGTGVRSWSPLGGTRSPFAGLECEWPRGGEGWMDVDGG
jgi:hypothetical protein